MSVILNALDEEQTTVMGGAHFTFKAGQMKHFTHEHIAKSIARLRVGDGLVPLPDEFESLALLKPELMEQVITPEQRDTLAAAKKQGIDNYCKKLRCYRVSAT